MLDKLFNWAAELSHQGWITAILVLIFFVFMIVTIIMLWQLKASHLNSDIRRAKNLSRQQKKSVLNHTEEINKDSASLVEEAEVFITYGLNQQAIDVLNRHLQAEPKDKKARKLLEQITQSDDEETLK